MSGQEEEELRCSDPRHDESAGRVQGVRRGILSLFVYSDEFAVPGLRSGTIHFRLILARFERQCLNQI